MNDSKFQDARKAFILKQRADGIPVTQIGRARYSSEHRPLGTIGNKPSILLQNPGEGPGPAP